MILSLVIPTYNKRALLERTLPAVLQQSMPTDAWEIIVVDDGSTDDTAEYLNREAARAGGRLKVVRPARNAGRAAARNLGVQAAAGRWILFLDDDILAPPNLLASHLALLEKHPGCGTIGAVKTALELIDAPHLHYIDTRGVAKVRGDIAPARYLLTQNAAVPREAILKVGGFDERFVTYGLEDTELAFRLEDEAGVTFLAARQVVPLHIHHHTLSQYLDKKRQVGQRSLPLLARLHPDRIREMKLHLAIDTDSAVPPPTWIRAFRSLACGSVLKLLQPMLAHWPTRSHHRPLMAGLYFRLMDALVVSAYCQGARRDAG